MKLSRTNLLNYFVLCASLKYLKSKSRISKVYAFFYKKKSHCY